MKRPIDLGGSDFRELRRSGACFVDKSSFVAGVVRDPARVVLLPRPRRFGKTLNLTMLRSFFDRHESDSRALFDGLQLESAGPDVWSHFGRHPVIFLTFKDTKATSWQTAYETIRLQLSELFTRHRRLAESGHLAAEELRAFESLRNRTADRSAWEASLRWLTEWWQRETGEKCVVLIDEYDTPAESGFGRSDVMVIPKCSGQPGVVMELKVLYEDETVEHALDAALTQLADRDYAQRLRDRGASPIQELALVFDGKRATARARHA